MNKHLDYLKNSYNRIYDNPIGEIKIGNVLVYVKEALPQNVDMRGCISYVLSRMPKNVIGDVERIMVGKFPFLTTRKVDAVYDDGIIYITNDHTSDMDFLTDLVHEIGHSFEEKNKDFLYGDEKIKSEFLHKRQKLYEVMDSMKLIQFPITKEHFQETKYNIKFDRFLYEDVGYEKLRNLTEGIFISPYAATSLREYFGNAFENFFTNDMFVVKKYSQSVYNKLTNFLEF